MQIIFSGNAAINWPTVKLTSFLYQDGLGGNAFDTFDNSSGCLIRTDYSGPASLDLTKDISANGLRPKLQNQSFDEKIIRHSQTVSEISSRIGKNGKLSSSHSSSNSSGNYINYSTGSSSLISNGSQTSNSVDLGAQVTISVPIYEIINQPNWFPLF